MTNNSSKIIPITIITGFLGSGKTTLINQILSQNSNIRFGLIINEFGEVGIDGKILDNPQEEITEISNGCLCCVVRSDLVEAIEKMVNTNKIDYIIVETSGLAEPEPILQTFMTLKTEGFKSSIKMDSLITVVDSLNYKENQQEYKVINQQIKLADIVVLNKVTNLSQLKVEELQSNVKSVNGLGSVLVNDDKSPSNLLIDTGSWNIDKLIQIENHCHTEATHHDHVVRTDPNHHHEHNQVEEVVFSTDKVLDPFKMDKWLQDSFPVNAIRAKGILRLQTSNGTSIFVFQMVGANKELIPFENYFVGKIPVVSRSSIVLIGKKLDRISILSDLSGVTVV